MPLLTGLELTKLMEKISSEFGRGRSSVGYTFDPKRGMIWGTGNTIIHDGNTSITPSNIRLPFLKNLRAAYDPVTGRYLGFYRNGDPLNPVIEVLPCHEYL